MTVFVETLTLRIWLQAVFPRLLWWRARGRSGTHRCYLIDSSRGARTVARWTGWIAGAAVEVLRFRMVEVRDEEGVLLALRIPTQDALGLRKEIMADPLVRDVISAQRAGRIGQRLPTYLAKAATASELVEPRTLWRALQVVQVCVWKLRHEPLGGSAVCFLERRPWFAAIARYASTYGIAVLPVRPTLTRWGWARRYLSAESLVLLRGLRTLWHTHARKGRMTTPRPSSQASAQVRMAVEYYGYFNLHRPDRHSDLFFWQRSSLTASDLLVVFHLPHDPLDGEKLAALGRRGMAAVALDPRATAVPSAPVFLPPLRLRGPRLTISRALRASRRPDARWLREALRDYEILRAFWSEFFAAHHVKLYVSWFKYTAAQCAMADALASVGGIAALYQRAYETKPFAGTTVDTDLMFGFSRAGADVERRAGSVIPYYVVTGYLGDHRFPLVREEALRVRQSLHHRGAQRIMSYCDENSHDDVRWHPGHIFERENYAFLLERVLAEPWLGLILKPKIPSTLRKRLGPVARLLERAESTGRCVVFEDGVMQGSSPPAAAALGSDVMIHGRLDSATAGMEAALAGVPTLLLDRLGWPVSPLYRLGVGRVVFTDWPGLWQACVEHWQRPGGIPGFGDWAPLLAELDPFRDGRAAERMGTYLQWLLDGFKAGRDRETVMADAAERYAARWGKDKVAQVNADVAARTARQPLTEALAVS